MQNVWTFLKSDGGRVLVAFLAIDRQVKNVGIVRVKVSNTGTEPIKGSDFERPITFFVGGEARVINSYIAETQAESFLPKLDFKEKEVILQSTLFNRKDSVTFNILVSDFIGKIYADARIEGVELKQPRSAKKGSFLQVMSANANTMAAIAGFVGLVIVMLQIAHLIRLELFGFLSIVGFLVLFPMYWECEAKFIKCEAIPYRHSQIRGKLGRNEEEGLCAPRLRVGSVRSVNRAPRSTA